MKPIKYLIIPFACSIQLVWAQEKMANYFYEMPAFKEMLSLKSPMIPDSIDLTFNWAHLNVIIKNGKQKSIAAVSSEGIKNAGDMFGGDLIYSSDVFGDLAQEYELRANEVTDAETKRQYRQLSISAREASIANLEMQQQFDRTMNTVQLTAAFFQTAQALYNNWTSNDMVRAINWAFDKENKAELATNSHLITCRFVRQNVNTRKKPFYYLFSLESTVKVNDDEVVLPPYDFKVIYYKKKELRELEWPEGYINSSDTYYAYELQEHTGFKQTYWENHIAALMLRRVAYDYKKLIELMYADANGL